MINHWRTLAQWDRGASLGERYVGDYPADASLPVLRLQIARDYLSFATQLPKGQLKRQEAMAELTKRFDKARVELKRIAEAYQRLRFALLGVILRRGLRLRRPGRQRGSGRR